MHLWVYYNDLVVTCSACKWYLGANELNPMGHSECFHCSMFIFTLCMSLLLLHTFNAGTKEATSRMTTSRGTDRTSLIQEANRSSLYCCILTRTWKKKTKTKFALVWFLYVKYNIMIPKDGSQLLFHKMRRLLKNHRTAPVKHIS